MKKSPIDIALHFLKFRPRTVFEVKTKLKIKGIKEEEIEKTINVLKRNGLLDDAEFAKMYVRDRNLLKPTGSNLLRLELRKLGVSKEESENALQAQDEIELAQRALESKSKYRDAEFEKKVQFLIRRGFTGSIIFKLLKKDT